MSLIEVDQGMRLYVEDRGSGRPIVFVHAWSLSHRFWEQQVAALSAQHRVVAFDQRGHGQSDKGNATYTVDALASDLHKVLTKLDLKDVVLVGWSMGVTACLQYMAKFQGERVAKLGLVCNGPYLIKTPEWPHGFSMEELGAVGEQMAIDRPRTLASFYGSLFATPPSQPMIDWVVRSCMDVPLAVAGALFQSELQTDLRPVLSSIKTPALVIVGEKDHPAGTGGGQFMAENLPSAKLLRFAKSGHFPMLEEAAAFTQAIAAFAQ